MVKFNLMMKQINNEFEDFGLREIIFILLLPLLVSILIFIYVFYLKRIEMQIERSNTMRIVLVFVGAFIGGMVLILSALTVASKIKYRSRLRLNPTLADSLFGVGNLMGFVIPMLLVISQLTNYNRKIEENALIHSGIKRDGIIACYDYSHGRHPHYNFYFYARSVSGKSYQLSVIREKKLLQIGDTVSFIYLPVNPTIYREIER